MKKQSKNASQLQDTICARFVHTSQRAVNKTALLHHMRGRWIERTWRDYYEMAERAALALHELGVSKGDRVAVFSNTRLEWAVCDFAVLGLGAITVPIYQNNTAEDLEYILNNSQAKVVFCEDQKTVEKFKIVAARCPHVRYVICFERHREKENLYMPWSEFSQLGEEALEHKVDFFRDSCLSRTLDEHATLMYTSGTTGLPKGVVLTHEQIMSEVGEAFTMVGVREDDLSLSFLPYAHVLGRIEMWGHVYIGFTMAFAQGMERLRENMAALKPTIMVAVPRLFEKIYVGLLNQVETSPTRARVFKWAMSAGRKVTRAQMEKQPLALADLLQYRVANKLVFEQIRIKLGGRLRFAISGGAPLSAEISEFFHAIGINILEGYGLTETTAAICVNTPFENRIGTVGKPIGDVQIRIADDGEILVKSKKVMKEYYQDPTATQAAIEDGWFHTGDIGEFTPDGFVRITDRKKELIKTAGGKYVAPQKLEKLLKTSKFISQAYIYGDRKKYIVALITLNADAVIALSKTEDLGSTDMGVLYQHPRIREVIRQAIADANTHLASYESIKNFSILARDFSIEQGEMTPSLKLKRKVIDETYKDTLDLLYR